MKNRLGVTILVEDTVYRPGLIGEHGLSVLIEYDDERWLFDTGQGAALDYNTRQLGTDLKGISGIIVSHGHYDHSGGLITALNQSGPARIYCHPGIFAKRCAVDKSGKKQRAGIKEARARIEAAGGDFVVNKEPVRLSSVFHLSGEIPRVTRHKERPDKQLKIRNGGKLVIDTVNDEQCLIARTSKGIVVLSGCAHRGIISTLDHALKLTGEKRVYALIGGMHLAHASDREIGRIVACLARFKIRKIAACHCTGPRAIEALRRAFPRNCVSASTGTRLEL